MYNKWTRSSGIFGEYKCEDKKEDSGAIRPWILCIREIDNTNHRKSRHGFGIRILGKKIEKFKHQGTNHVLFL